MNLGCLGNGWNEFHKSWNPPNGDELWSRVGYPLKDLNGKELKGSTTLYKFPWYLRPLGLWYRFKCWRKTGKWPERVLYFSEEQQRDKEIFLEVHKNLDQYFSY